MTTISRPAPVAAVFLPAGRPPSQIPFAEGRFALVSSTADFAALTAQGVDSILLQRRPSSHYAVPLLVRLAGPLIVPWRWRRILLNEGIEVVLLPRTARSAPLALGALLARSRVTWCAPQRASGSGGER